MQPKASPDTVVGILLAAGRGARFDPAGVQNKLLQRLPDGREVAVASAKNLLEAIPSVLSVVRAGNDALGESLRSAGCEVTVCPNAEEGMAASLVHALSLTRDARGWVIALGDMPYVKPSTITKLAAAVSGGAAIAAPVLDGRRGNPVAFGRAHLDALLQLRGDEGARHLLRNHPVTEVQVDDPGILRDIDTPEDLSAR